MKVKYFLKTNSVKENVNLSFQNKIKKPVEPVIILLISIIAIIIGLNLNFVSLKEFGIIFLAYKGVQIKEALYLFGISSFSSLISIIIYCFGNNRKYINLARNITIFGVISGLISSILIFNGFYFGDNKTVVIQKLQYNNFTLIQAKSLVDSLSPDIGFLIAFVGLLLMILGAYIINNTKFEYFGLPKKSVNYPDLFKFDNEESITIENLEIFWICPNDFARLISNESRLVPNPVFTLTRERLDYDLDNAVSMKKIPNDILPFVRRLSLILFKKSKKFEIKLTSTICPVCKRQFISPELSDWKKN